jgi:TIR domain
MPISFPGRGSTGPSNRKIEQCAAFVVIMTPASNESDWVHDELDLAKARNRDLMPILLAGERFFGLGRTQCEDVRTGEMPGSQYLNALRSLVGGEGELRFAMKAHKGQIRSVAFPAKKLVDGRQCRARDVRSHMGSGGHGPAAP